MDPVVSLEREHPSNRSILLLLSLKLILLAFFILLNALSKYEEDRTRAVLESVTRTFTGRPDPVEPHGSFGGAPGMLPNAAPFAGQIGGLLDSLLPVAGATAGYGAREVVVDVSESALFAGAAIDLRPEGRSFVRRLARGLVPEPGSAPRYALEFQHGLPDWAPGASTAYQDLAVRRAAAVARRLTADGLPPAVVSIGLLPNRPGALRFILRAAEAGGDAAPAGGGPR